MITDAYKVKPPEGMARVLISMYWNLYPDTAQRLDTQDVWDAQREFRAEVLALVGGSLCSDWYPVDQWSIGQPKRGLRDDGTMMSRQSAGLYYIHGDQEVADRLQRIYELTCKLMTSAYHAGQRRGKSFITDLAEGKMTVKDLERL